MSWTEITVLVEKAQAGDREAYGELVTRFERSVEARARTWVRNKREARELAVQARANTPRWRRPTAPPRPHPCADGREGSCSLDHGDL